MNEREVAELRRRFRPEKNSISKVRGCYVNDQKEIISEFHQTLGAMSEEEGQALLGILKKTLSGALGKNLLDVEFTTQQVLQGEEHKLLMTLRNSHLEDEEAAQSLYRKIIDSVQMSENYMILLAADSYDVPAFGKDGARQEDSQDVFSYFLCSVCPVKLKKPALSYYTKENRFFNTAADLVVCPPELGFLFPAFDDRSANIYNTLCYTRSAEDNHPAFIDALFKAEAPMAAEMQKETFQSMLSYAVGEDCSMQVVQTVHEELCNLIAEHKASHEKEPLTVTKATLKGVLAGCGVSEEHVEAFSQEFDAQFGADSQLSPRNLVDTGHFQLKTPDVTIRVNPDRKDLIETRVIGGNPYILIRADEGVEVNGVPVQIEERKLEKCSV